MNHSPYFSQEIKKFKKHNGLMQTSMALEEGIHPRALYAMAQMGMIEKVDRGLYRLAQKFLFSNLDLVSVAVRVRKATICLISALAYHEITTQIPHEVYVALPFGTERPRIKYPPTTYCWLKEPAYCAGRERKIVDGIAMYIYSPEKTVADCFKFRNRIGLDVALEALKLCLKRKRSKPDELLKYAKICRVERVMKPYLEAMV